ncbi:MAG: hypothetical protein QJR14_02835, partial [Bacillota bacterium]|nr:hypothetical protein [Bacillota bacterium]
LPAQGGTAAAGVAEEWLRRLGELFLPDLLLERAREGAEEPVPLARGRSARDGRPTAYVCRGRSCLAPMVRWAEMERALR